MPEPSTFPDWDTNLTHTSPITSGHKTDGFAEDEIPDSDELNTLFNLQGQWIRYLLGRFSAVATWFGDGLDGAIVLDGTSTITFPDGVTMAPTSMVYDLPRDISCTNITINSGVTLVTAGFRVFATGTLTNNGTIQWNGNAGAGHVAGAGLSNAGPLGQGAAGGTGGTANAVGTAASAISYGYPAIATAAAAWYNPGGTCAGGSGGSGGAIGAAGGAVTRMPAANGAAHLTTAINGVTANGTKWLAASGGGGGGGSANNTPGVGFGGGGGGGAGTIVIAANIIAGTGNIEAIGGAGGQGEVTSGAVIDSGGGGGGGGGIIIVVYNTLAATQTISAAGGAGGAPGTGGASSGVVGAAGGAGVVMKYNLSGDGT